MSDEFMQSTNGGSKHPPLTFPTVGTTHSGLVLEVKKLEDRDLGTGQPKTFDNGDPRYVFVFTLQTATETANLWVRGQMQKAIREAADKAGVSTLVGCTLAVRYTGDGEKKSAAFNAPKLYAAKVDAPVKDDSANMW